MELDPYDSVDAQLIFCPQLYDRKEIAFLKNILMPGDTFVDVGAHVGFYSLMASKFISKGKILAIEANPETFETLYKNSLLNESLITVLNTGVSDREEVLDLWIQTRGNKGGTSFINAGDGASVKVKCKPLAKILQEADIEAIKVLKIDIEGYEHKVLAHFLSEVPRTMWPNYVVTEFFPHLQSRSTGDQVALLHRHGYVDVLNTGYNRVLHYSS